MSILSLLHASVVFFAFLQCCYYVSLATASKIVEPQEVREQNYRLWNDSYVWPAPEYEVYEYMKSSSSDGTNLTRVLIDGDWEFVYGSANDTNRATERWNIIMNAAKERFQYFLNRSKTATNTNFYNDIATSNDEGGMKKLTFTTASSILIPLKGIRFHISNLSETTLHYDLDESYEIQILNPLSTSKPETGGYDSIQNASNYIEITATNVFGALYGLETLKQLIHFIGCDDGVPMFGIFNNTYKLYIHDAPVYSYRGIMIDTARHYLPLQLIQQNLYIMLTNKLNVLHWHMSDTQSFPYASMKFPELAQHGAYCYPECTYNTSDIKMIIETAALLGIHVIVEIDLPTHSQAIGNSHPELLSQCANGVLSEPLNATDEALYDFVYDLYDEITNLFTDDYIHLGGDEVSLECWESSTNLHKWMLSHNMTKTVEVLQYFEMNLLQYVLNHSQKRPIVWQDLFDMDVKGIPSNVIFDVWKEWIMEESVYKTTAADYDILFSACWYLDHLNENWWTFYTCNPRNMPNLTSAQRSHILGGHTSMWGESVDSTNFYERVWPRSSATAEVLWSGSPNTIPAELSLDRIQVRLERFRCYMLEQFDVPISPISPGHCQSHGPVAKLEKMQSIIIKE